MLRKYVETQYTSPRQRLLLTVLVWLGTLIAFLGTVWYVKTREYTDVVQLPRAASNGDLIVEYPNDCESLDRVPNLFSLRPLETSTQPSYGTVVSYRMADSMVLDGEAFFESLPPLFQGQAACIRNIHEHARNVHYVLHAVDCAFDTFNYPFPGTNCSIILHEQLFSILNVGLVGFSARVRGSVFINDTSGFAQAHVDRFSNLDQYQQRGISWPCQGWTTGICPAEALRHVHVIPFLHLNVSRGGTSDQVLSMAESVCLDIAIGIGRLTCRTKQHSSWAQAFLIGFPFASAVFRLLVTVATRFFLKDSNARSAKQDDWSSVDMVDSLASVPSRGAGGEAPTVLRDLSGHPYHRHDKGPDGHPD